jgi:hypothetical protein
MTEASTTQVAAAVCPGCGWDVVAWPDGSGGVTINFWCPNAHCASGKGPWDTPFPPYEFGAWSAIPSGFKRIGHVVPDEREVLTVREDGTTGVWVTWMGSRP